MRWMFACFALDDRMIVDVASKEKQEGFYPDIDSHKIEAPTLLFRIALKSHARFAFYMK